MSKQAPKRTIENAPGPFRKELEDLKKRGVLDSPVVKAAFTKALNRVRDHGNPVS